MGATTYQRSVPVVYTHLLYDYLEARGVDASLVLGRPRLSADPEQRDRVDVQQWETMLIAAGEHLQDRYIGLRLGEMVNARHLGLVGHLLWSCEDFGAVLQRLERFQRLIFDAIPMARRDRDDAIEMVWDISEFRTGPLVGETGFATMIQFCRSVMQGEADPHSIDFAHPPPEDTQPFEDFFRCPVRFNCPEPIIRVDYALLQRPLRRTDPALEQVLEQHAVALLERLPSRDEVLTRLRRALAGQLRDGEPKIDVICHELRLSARTLQRRLREAGTSFRHELNLVRNELAQSYLRDPSLQITDVAMLLGYSEHSAFTRAFRKQNGLSPQQLRDQVKAGTETSTRLGVAIGP